MHELETPPADLPGLETPDAPHSEGAVGKALDGVASVCMAFAGTLLVILIVIFGWLVYGRYILNATPTWVEQASLLIVVWITFLGAAVGVRRNSHLAVEFLRDAAPPRLRAAMLALATVAMTVFGSFMAWQGWLLVQSTQRREIPLLGISEGWRAAPMAVAGVLIVIFTLDALAAQVMGARKTKRS